KDAATTSNEGDVPPAPIPEVDGGPMEDEGGVIASPSDSGTEAAPLPQRGSRDDGADAAPIGDGSCWSVPVVNHARLFPALCRTADLVNGTILGSTTSPTNDFVELATVTATPIGGTF